MSGGGGPETFFFKISTYFTESRTDLPREAIGPEGSNCFSRGSVPVFVRNHIEICNFLGRGGGSGFPAPLCLAMEPPIIYINQIYISLY